MPSLKNQLTQILNNSTTDTELAQDIVDSDLLSQILQQATYTETQTQQQMQYASPESFRAVLSKAHRGQGTFPLPILEGPHWSRTEIDAYKKQHRSARRGPIKQPK